LPLYSAVYEVIGQQFSADKALFRNDYEQRIDEYIEAITLDIRKSGKIVQAVAATRDALVS